MKESEAMWPENPERMSSCWHDMMSAVMLWTVVDITSTWWPPSSTAPAPPWPRCCGGCAGCSCGPAPRVCRTKPRWSSLHCSIPGCEVELQTNLRQTSRPIWPLPLGLLSISWLKLPNSAFTFKTLLRRYLFIYLWLQHHSINILGWM